jgi:hypothetical protein
MHFLIHGLAILHHKNNMLMYVQCVKEGNTLQGEKLALLVQRCLAHRLDALEVARCRHHAVNDKLVRLGCQGGVEES